MDKKFIIYLFLSFLPVLAMEKNQNNLKNIHLDVQKYLAIKFLNWNEVSMETDPEFTIRSEKRIEDKYKGYDVVAFPSRTKKNSLQKKIYSATIKDDIEIWQAGNYLLINKEKFNPSIQQLESMLSTFSFANNEKYIAFETSPSNRYLCALTQKTERNTTKNCFYHADLYKKVVQLIPIPIPTDYNVGSIILENKNGKELEQEAITLINKGYDSRGLLFQRVELINAIHAFATHPKFIAFATVAGIFLIKIYEDNAFIKLKDFSFNTYPENHNLSKAIEREAQVYELEFNKQGTKLWVKYQNNSNVSTSEIIKLPNRDEPQKTLVEYFKRKLVCKNLNEN